MSGICRRGTALQDESGGNTCVVCLELVGTPVFSPHHGDVGRIDTHYALPATENATLKCGHQFHLSCLLQCLLPHRDSQGLIPAQSRCPTCRCQVSDQVTAVTSRYESALGSLDPPTDLDRTEETIQNRQRELRRIEEVLQRGRETIKVQEKILLRGREALAGQGVLLSRCETLTSNSPFRPEKHPSCLSTLSNGIGFVDSCRCTREEA